jgi:hypothetical protein
LAAAFVSAPGARPHCAAGANGGASVALDETKCTTTVAASRVKASRTCVGGGGSATQRGNAESASASASASERASAGGGKGDISPRFANKT